MKTIKYLREEKHLSQRKLAEKAAISYKTLQLIESDRKDMKLSSLKKIAEALGCPHGSIDYIIETYLSQETESIMNTSLNIYFKGEKSWKLFLFDFVDAFRRKPLFTMIKVAPVQNTAPKIKALLASTVEALCSETGINIPDWCKSIHELPLPWFVSGYENLKASALMESPVFFRKRNIFVLANFLERV